jgi:uncharacterized membrane protein HdeD (DUF308 family)
MDMGMGETRLAERHGIHWWALVIRGVVAVLFGILAISWPGITLAVLLVLFGLYALANGILAVIAAVGSAEGRRHWCALLITGIVGIAAGIVAFAYPGITLVALLYVIAAWAVISGIFEIVAAVSGTGDVGTRWLFGLSGVLSVLFGILLFAYPLTGLLAVAWLIGFYAIFYGFTQIVLGLQLHGFETRVRPTTAMQH